MSIKFDIWMIIFMPYYLYKVFIKSHSNRFIYLFYFIFCLVNWIFILISSKYIILGYVCANIGITGLFIGNIYTHVTNSSEIVDRSFTINNFLFDLIVGVGSVFSMMLFAYLPYEAIYRYVNIENIIKCNFSIFSLLTIFSILHVLFVIMCKEIFLEMPKDNHGITKKNNVDYNTIHILVAYIVCCYLFYLKIYDKKFISTMKIFLCALV